jgi:hypothetical protein
MTDNNTQKKPFYKKWWVIALAIAFVLGSIITVFQDDEADEYNGSGADYTSTYADTLDADDNSPDTPTEDEPPAVNEVDISGISFDIVEIRDYSVPNLRQFEYDVVVHDEVTSTQLEGLAVYIVESAKSEKEFDYLRMFFNDYSSFIGSGFTLGRVTYTSGDYENTIRNKDWSLRPTLNEVEIYSSWHQAFHEQHEHGTPTDDDINVIIAERYDISIEYINDIFLKVGIWRFNDTSKTNGGGLSSVFTAIQIIDQANTWGDVVGQRGLVEIVPAFLTDELLIAFYHEHINGSGMNYFTIDFGNNTGFVFPGSSNRFHFGILDDSGAPTGYTDGMSLHGYILDDCILYTTFDENGYSSGMYEVRIDNGGVSVHRLETVDGVMNREARDVSPLILLLN